MTESDTKVGGHPLIVGSIWLQHVGIRLQPQPLHRVRATLAGFWASVLDQCFAANELRLLDRELRGWAHLSALQPRAGHRGVTMGASFMRTGANYIWIVPTVVTRSTTVTNRNLFARPANVLTQWTTIKPTSPAKTRNSS